MTGTDAWATQATVSGGAECWCVCVCVCKCGPEVGLEKWARPGLDAGRSGEPVKTWAEAG